MIADSCETRIRYDNALVRLVLSLVVCVPVRVDVLGDSRRVEYTSAGCDCVGRNGCRLELRLGRVDGYLLLCFETMSRDIM